MSALYTIENKNNRLKEKVVKEKDIKEIFINECNICIDNNIKNRKQIKLWKKEIEKCENEIYSIEDIIEILENEFDYIIKNIF